jgi:hypothetical protein
LFTVVHRGDAGAVDADALERAEVDVDGAVPVERLGAGRTGDSKGQSHAQ